jgi:hypothetical protein
MDLRIVATSAVSLLVPYFAKAGEAFAEKVGERLFARMDDLHATIKRKFERDDYAAQTLNRVEEKPKSEGRQAALREVLAEKMGEDAEFASRVDQLVKEISAQSEASQGDVITQHLGISGKAGNVFQVGKAEGDITSVRGDANVIGDASESLVEKKTD